MKTETSMSEKELTKEEMIAKCPQLLSTAYAASEVAPMMQRYADQQAKKEAIAFEREIERLKELIEILFKENNGVDFNEIDGHYEIFQSKELQEKEWQQFKTENNL